MADLRASIFGAIQTFMSQNYEDVPVVWENGPVPDEAAIGNVFLDVEIRWDDAANVTLGHTPRGRDWGHIATFVYYKQAEGTALPDEIAQDLRDLLSNRRLGAGETKLAKRVTSPELRGWYRTGLLTPFRIDSQGSVASLAVPAAPPDVDYVEFLADGAIGGHRVMSPTTGGRVGYASSSNVADANTVLGISRGAALDGAILQVQNGGLMTESSWSWTVDQPIFCGVNGVLTQTAPTVGFQLIVGVATSATSMAIGIRQPILVA